MLRSTTSVFLLAFAVGCGQGGVLDLDPSTARTGAESADDGRSGAADDGRATSDRDADTRSEERGDSSDRDDGASRCAERCRSHAVGLYESCVDAGRDEGACARWARSEFGTCVDDHCDDSGSSSDRDERDSSGRDDGSDGVCEERCGSYARGLYESCVDAGRDEAACSRWGRSEYGSCVEDHC